MSNHQKSIKTSIRNFIFALILLLLTNAIMALALESLAKKQLRTQVDQRMLDIANTAAYQLNGDEIRGMTAADVGTPEYERALGVLRSFQENIGLDYIYSIQDNKDGTFSYAIDPYTVNPAEFGETIQTTPELVTAAQGTPAVEHESHTDDWGTFYSAFSPVYDSKGEITGIVGVDFTAEWYDSCMNSGRVVSAILLMAALSIGIVLAFLLLSDNRKRFMVLFRDLEKLNQEMGRLDDIIMKSSIKKLDMLPESESAVLKTLAGGENAKRTVRNEYDELGFSVESLYKKLHKYLRYVDAEVLIDDTTGVLNKVAYKEKTKELDDAIQAGNALFSVAFFDINGLKKVYTHQGFEAGDMMMFECAKILKSIFGKGQVFHLIGDEFIVLYDQKLPEDMERCLKCFDEELAKYNAEQTVSNKLSVAKGYCAFNPECFSDYRHVFIEAQINCHEDKKEYYKTHTR